MKPTKTYAKYPRIIASIITLILCCFTTYGQVPVSLSPVARQQFLNASGQPLTGGLIYTYAAGTTTPLATYTDSSGLYQASNPIVLDSGGFSTIWLAEQSYKFVVTDANNVQQYTVDNVSDLALINSLNSVLLTRNQTIGGNKTFTGTTIFQGAASFSGSASFSVLNNVVYVGGVTYPATAAGINSAINSTSGASTLVFVNTPGSYCDTVVNPINLTALQFGPGTYQLNISGADSTTANVTWGVWGISNQTIIQSCPGSNVDVITHKNFSTFTGGTSFYGTFNVTLSGLIIDGNKASETGGYCTRIYGRGMQFTNVVEQNCYSDGRWTEWGGTEADTSSANNIEARFYNTAVSYSNGTAWTHKGPNDSIVTGFSAHNNGCWGWEVDSPTHASHVNTYENDNTSPGTCGGIHEANSGGLSGDDIVGSSATGWGMLVDTSAGANLISNGAWGGQAAIGLETRNGAASSIFQGVCANENSGVDCLKINGSGNGIYDLVFSANTGNHNIHFASEVTPNTIVGVSDGTPTGWYTGTPGTSDTLILGTIPGRAASGFLQFPNGKNNLAMLGQIVGSQFAGECGMSGTSTCTSTPNGTSYTSTPLCFAQEDGGTTAGYCSYSAGTVTVTAASTNSYSWKWLLVGNPN